MSEMVKDYGRGWGHTSWILERHGRSDRGCENARKLDVDRRGRESGLQLPRAGLGYLYGESKTKGDSICYTEKE